MSDTTTPDRSYRDPNAEHCGFWPLIRVMFRMNFLLMARYRLNFIIQLLGMYVFFALMFFGGQQVAGQLGAIGSLGASLNAVIVGWFLYSMAQNAYSSLSGVITSESRWGTLEQLYISPHGFFTIMGAKVLINIVLSLLVGFLMLGLMLVTTGRTLSLNVVTVLTLVVLTLLSILGIGFIFGGLTLIYKKLSSVSQLMQLAILGLVAAPSADIFVLRFLPLVQGSSMLQDAMRNGTRLWEFPVMDLAILLAAAAIYLGLGTVVFLVCSQEARQRGVMGHY